VTTSHAASGLFVGWGRYRCSVRLLIDILLFDVLFLFVRARKECELAVSRTIAAQTHATWFQHCCFPSKSRIYGTEIDLSWADRWLVRSRSANFRFMSRLRIFGPRFWQAWHSGLYSYFSKLHQAACRGFVDYCGGHWRDVTWSRDY